MSACSVALSIGVRILHHFPKNNGGLMVSDEVCMVALHTLRILNWPISVSNVFLQSELGWRRY